VEQALGRLNKKKNRPFETSMLEDLSIVLRDLSGAFSVLESQLAAPNQFLLEQRVEQAPHPESRVVLSGETDALGSRRASLDWQISDVDVRTFQVGQDAVIKHFGGLGIGRVDAPDLTREVLERQVQGRHHHLGTTRMSESPRDGVVDRNCRVHGVDNLFIAGGSVFCRAMFCGPTMTMMGLAYRLADHLAGVMKSAR
jgi:choline dehydrogenase-like flavoprotein